jgi:hypothetical protein
MYNPYLYDVARVRMDELAAEATHARQRRELAGPGFLERLTTKWRRPSAGSEQRRPAQPAVTRWVL